MAGRQIVEHDHRVPGVPEGPDSVAAYVPCSTGNQNSRHAYLPIE